MAESEQEKHVEARVPFAQLTNEEKEELLDWVSACQSSYARQERRGGPLGQLPDRLDENRDGLVSYVNSLLEARWLATEQAQSPEPSTASELQRALQSVHEALASAQAALKKQRHVDMDHSRAEVSVEQALLASADLLVSLAPLERDAARYRWLRNESWAGYNFAKGKPQVAETVVFVEGGGSAKTILAEDALDSAVDCAINALRVSEGEVQ